MKIIETFYQYRINILFACNYNCKRKKEEEKSTKKKKNYEIKYFLLN